MKYLLLFVYICLVYSQAVTYSCCFFQNDYESSISAVSCTNQYCPSVLTGWTLSGLKQTTNCYFCTSHFAQYMNSTKEHEDLNDHVVYHESDDFVVHYHSKRVDEDEKEYIENVKYHDQHDDELVSNYKCCVYSSPESSYYWPIYTFNSNPSSGHDCPSSLYGETFLGSWYTNSLYNQCYFILRY
jgi:hypothetical protein